MKALDNNPDILLLLLILTGIILIAEMRASSKWKIFYFLKGPVIFSKTYKLKAINSINELSRELENNFARKLFPSIIFRQLDENVIGFREKLFEFAVLAYTPVMHGTVMVNNVGLEITVEGRPNWFAMAFSVLWLIANPFGAFGFLFYIALTLSLYGIQYYRFAKVGEVTLKILNSNTTT